MLETCTAVISAFPNETKKQTLIILDDNEYVCFYGLMSSFAFKILFPPSIKHNL